jgi:hypothetical protein
MAKALVELAKRFIFYLAQPFKKLPLHVGDEQRCCARVRENLYLNPPQPSFDKGGSYIGNKKPAEAGF